MYYLSMYILTLKQTDSCVYVSVYLTALKQGLGGWGAESAIYCFSNSCMYEDSSNLVYMDWLCSWNFI